MTPEQDPARCDWCGRRLDRPVFPSYECFTNHPAPMAADWLVEDVERFLGDRRGMGWSGLDEEILDELRADLAEAIRQRLAVLKQQEML